jgi:hypothetical protein
VVNFMLPIDNSSELKKSRKNRREKSVKNPWKIREKSSVQRTQWETTATVYLHFWSLCIWDARSILEERKTIFSFLGHMLLAIVHIHTTQFILHFKMHISVFASAAWHKNNCTWKQTLRWRSSLRILLIYVPRAAWP